jgi:phosphoglucosamine mutase
MARLFGTDGVRGVAGSELTPELAINIGRAAAMVLTKHTNKKAKVLIGKDTRISGDMLESALSAGLCSVGADVQLCGVVPTPAIAYLVKKYGCDAGVVISASHNPMEFNGIKIFNGEGFKLADEIENEIEALILDTPEKIVNVTGGDMGVVTRINTAARDYIDYLKTACTADLSGMKVVFDCANGASSVTAPTLFTELGVQATFIGAQPNGTNINDGCGSTHLDNLAKGVKEGGFDCGIAFDGDADRCLAIDENGEEIDGDKIIAILATRMKAQGRLAQDTAVVTVMSNLGFMKHMEKRGINTAITAVGDRYVLERMLADGYNIGGEQSGHVIFLDHNSTGDGVLTAIQLLSVLKRSGKKASELADVMQVLPQVLVNARVNNAKKNNYMDDEVVRKGIEELEQEFSQDGRVLIRTSGTEPLVRVMIEGKDIEKMDKAARKLASLIEERLK